MFPVCVTQGFFFQPLGQIKYVKPLFTEQGPRLSPLGISQVVVSS